MILVLEPSFESINVHAFGGPKSAENGYATYHIKEASDPARLANELKKITGDEAPGAIGLRLLFGGDLFPDAARVNDAFLASIDKLLPSYPAYFALVKCVLEALRKAFKTVPATAFFETSFFTRLPESEKLYAVGPQFYEERGIKRSGFHGLTHGFCGRQLGADSKIISLVFDKQTTVCAIKERYPVGISLGLTPLEGIMGEKNCGDIDPGIVLFLMKKYGYSAYKMDSLLKRESGFYGMTGYSLPLAGLIKLIGRNPKVDLAFDLYESHITRYVGEGLALMGGVDAFVVSGANARPLFPLVYRMLKRISFLGINMPELPVKETPGIQFFPITSAGSAVQVFMNYTSVPEILCKELF